MSLDDKDIIAEFVVESREHLADIENELLAIEACGENIDGDLVNKVFRAVHSIKGAAGFFGFSQVQGLAHELENVLNLIRNRKLVPTSPVTDVLLRAADRLRGMIEDVEHSNDVDVSEHVAELRAVAAGEPAFAPPTVAELTSSEHEEAPDPERQLQVVENLVARAATEGATAGPAPAAVPRPASSAAAPREAGTAEAAPRESKSSAPSPLGETSIRVAVNILDRLMTLAGELVLARNQLLQTASTADSSAWGAVVARVNQVTSELQETIMQTRLQPIGAVFSRFPRVIRDLSSALGKQCQLTIEGQEVELDKSIIEAIGDPLTHLVRNAVDHGIEAPEARVKAGKPPAGTVALRAFHQAGKVSIQIHDDGRGIDAARLKEKAVAQGILTPEQARAMSDREALLLIFRPGLSTADKVTSVSGRGVGMDVVKTNIERLGGTVAVDTQLGRGTTIDVRLPLTLAIVPALIVRCCGQRYAIPQANIRELVRVKSRDAAKSFERIQGAEVFHLRETLLPLVRLDAALDRGEPRDAPAAKALNIIVVEAGSLRYGLVVEGLCDSEEIVVKPLGRHMKRCACLAGATILGDGKVALILDIAGIASHMRLAMPETESAADASGSGALGETQSLLLFTNHPSEYFGIPMELVARLERVRTDQIDRLGGQQILQYRGGTLPLFSLEDGVECKARPQASKVYVAVFATAEREAGLIVPEIIDIRSVPTRVDTETFRQPGITGSLVFERMTVRLVDLHELARKLRPDWYQSRSAVPTPNGAAPRILVAEDSDFFRKQLIGFFAAEGYEVQAAEDGAAAWDLLADPANRFDAVVTDIEMPNLTGLELARRIRGDARFADLPIIAVTSLAGDDDIRRGLQAGINEYHVKLDREQLMAATARLLKASLPRAASRSKP